MQSFVKIGRTVAEYSNLSIFSRWRPYAILDLQREFDGLYHRAKFGFNRITRFDNTKV